MIRPLLATVAIALLFAPSTARAADPFEFKDGDRVVLIGSTLIEREQKYGYWELALTLKNRDKNVTFRNLGWSGDTVWGEARNGFDSNPRGFERLVALTKELKPTVIVVCYGHNESFEGEAGVDKFTKQLEKLLDAIAVTKARIVLMSPTPFVKSDALPKPLGQSLTLGKYAKAIKEVAAARNLDYHPMFESVFAADLTDKLSQFTDNGLHWSGEGYRYLAGHLSEPQTATFSETWPATIFKPDSDLNQLRQKIIAKNRLFFHRWRPQNETYLLGFRKHEQGKNAVEIAEFDPLVAEKEKEIAELKKSLKQSKK